MNEGLIPRRYAKALLKTAIERGVDASLYDRMRRLADAFDAEPALGTTVANPFVAAADKERLILTAAGASADADTLLVDFIHLLERNKRIAVLRQAALAYIDLYRREHHIYHVEVVTAAPMAKDVEQRLRKLISSHIKDATMEYSEKVDPALMGGFVVNIDSQRLDASVANDLKQLRLQLLS